jgi:hypothetical protein
VIFTAGVIMWVEEYLSEGEQLSCIEDLSWVANRININHVRSIHERFAAMNIQWASRRGLLFDSA